MKGLCKNPYLYIWMKEFRLWTIAPDLFFFYSEHYSIVYLPLCYPPIFPYPGQGVWLEIPGNQTFGFETMDLAMAFQNDLAHPLCEQNMDPRAGI